MGGPMFPQTVRSFLLILLAVPFLGCSTFDSGSNSASPDGKPYFESSFNDHNKAPSQFSPPSTPNNTEGPLDEVYIRTQADYQFSMGEALSYEGQHLKAIEAFKMVTVYDPQSSHVHLRMAAEYVRLGMITEALGQAELALQKNPKFVDALLLLGGIHSTLKLYNKAIESYETVLKIEPANTEAPLYLGAVYAEQKKYDKALRYFEMLTKNEDYESPHLAHYYVGRLRSDQEGVAQQKQAVTAFKKALALKPDHLDSLNSLVEVLEKQNKHKEALNLYVQYQREHGPSIKVAEILAQKYLENEDYDSAFQQLELLEDSSEDPISVKLRMALVLIEKKKYPMAIDKLHDVLRQVPESDKIRFYLAAVYEEMQENSKAIEHFLKIQPESSFYGEAVVHAGYLLKKEGQLDKAIDVVGHALTQKDDVSQFYAMYASFLDEKGSYKEAVALLEKGVVKFPDQVQIRFFLGTVYDRLGEKLRVVENMKHVIEMDPNHVQGLNYLAYTYAEKEANLDEAEKLVRRALELEPKDGFVMDTYGWILYKQGKIKDAIRMLEAAHKYQPQEAIIAEHLGDAYYKVQMISKARTMYMRAFEFESDDSKKRQIEAKISALEKQDIEGTAMRQPASPEVPREAQSGN
jgi:tetratricopeptide (TPR) repeat protein